MENSRGVATFAEDFVSLSWDRDAIMATTLTLQQARDRLARFLQAHRLRNTRERGCILDQAMSMQRAFTVGEIREALEKDGFHVSRSTVYETLWLLCQCGVLVSLSMGVGEIRFAPRRFGYLYLVCSSCGKIREEKDPTVVAHFKGRRFEAFTADYFTTSVYGLCSTCQRRQRREHSGSETPVEKITTITSRRSGSQKIK